MSSHVSSYREGGEEVAVGAYYKANIEDKITICKLGVRWRSYYTYLTCVSSSAHHGQYVNLRTALSSSREQQRIRTHLATGSSRAGSFCLPLCTVRIWVTQQWGIGVRKQPNSFVVQKYTHLSVYSCRMQQNDRLHLFIIFSISHIRWKKDERERLVFNKISFFEVTHFWRCKTQI